MRDRPLPRYLFVDLDDTFTVRGRLHPDVLEAVERGHEHEAGVHEEDDHAEAAETAHRHHPGRAEQVGDEDRQDRDRAEDVQVC